MLSILHDWDDDDAMRILQRVREATARGTILLIGDAVLADANEWDMFKSLDVHVLVMLGGKERSEPEWRDLLAASGFRVDAVTRSARLGCVAATAV